MYKVRWSLLRDGRSFGLEESRRIVRAGEPLGFRIGGNRRVVALAGKHEIPLDNLPPRARFCVWSCTLEEPTGVAASMASVGSALIDAQAVIAVGIVKLTLDSLDDDDDGTLNFVDTGNDSDGDSDDEPEPLRTPADRGDRYERWNNRVEVKGG